jgi:hypothetical protein
VPATPKLSKKSGLLQLALEQLERALQAVFIAQPDFGHPDVLV